MSDQANERCVVALTRASALSGRPGRVLLVITNDCVDTVEVVSSAFEVKRAYSGSPHSLPRAGWGYAVTDALPSGVSLPPGSDFWTQVEADSRTVFGGYIPVEPPPEAGPHLYLAGKVLYRRGSGQFYETAFYRRLAFPAMTFSFVEPADEPINYAGERVVRP